MNLRKQESSRFGEKEEKENCLKRTYWGLESGNHSLQKIMPTTVLPLLPLKQQTSIFCHYQGRQTYESICHITKLLKPKWHPKTKDATDLTSLVPDVLHDSNAISEICAMSHVYVPQGRSMDLRCHTHKCHMIEGVNVLFHQLKWWLLICNAALTRPRPWGEKQIIDLQGTPKKSSSWRKLMTKKIEETRPTCKMRRGSSGEEI